MAGNYPDCPSRRMAWDADGTIGLNNVVNGGDAFPYAEFSTGDKVELNDEDNTNVQYQSGASPQGHYAIIFPELRDIDGVFAGATNSNHIAAFDTSADTTNGTDGVWTNRIANLAPSVNTYPNYRNDIQTAGLGVSGVRGVRFLVAAGANSYVESIHIYGTITAGSTPDKLVFIDVATGLEFVLPQDWGDVPRGTIHDKTIRIKNNSTGLAATDITLSFEDLYLGSSAWYTIKETAGAYASTLAIGQISPGVTYPTSPAVITVRKTVPDDETLGLHAARLKAHTTTWGTHAYTTSLSGTSTLAALLTAG